MLDTFFGLPVHALIVHATVVIVPAAAVAVLLAALWGRFRAWARWGPLALAVTAAILAPLSTSSGENLQHRVGNSALIAEHSELGDMLIWWAVPVALLAAVGYWLHSFRGGRHGRTGQGAPRVVSTLTAVLTVAVSVGMLVQVVLIGHSGAEAVWSDTAASAISASVPGQPA